MPRNTLAEWVTAALAVVVLVLFFCTALGNLGCSGAPVLAYDGATFDAGASQVGDTWKADAEITASFQFVGVAVVAESHYTFDGVGHIATLCLSVASAPRVCVKARKDPATDATIELEL